MNKETLKPFKSGNNAIENGKKGGLKSAEERKKKKYFKEVVKDILNQKPTSEEIKEVLKTYTDLDIEDITYRTLLIDKQMKKALNGDLRACEFILSVSGEKPKEGEEVRETHPPIINIEVVDNSEIENEFFLYEEAARREISIEQVRAEHQERENKLKE